MREEETDRQHASSSPSGPLRLVDAPAQGLPADPSDLTSPAIAAPERQNPCVCVCAWVRVCVHVTGCVYFHVSVRVWVGLCVSQNV